jgi:hypothetical protein
MMVEIAAACLHQNDEQAVPDGETLASLLDDVEIGRLCRSVTDALDIIGPWIPYSSHGDWVERLAIGAMHPTNIIRAQALSSSIDSGFTHTVPRPDRFFGVPLDDVTEGQWMAFRAARKSFNRRKP